jgi:hypothetical protein
MYETRTGQQVTQLDDDDDDDEFVTICTAQQTSTRTCTVVVLDVKQCLSKTSYYLMDISELAIDRSTQVG